MYCWTSHAVLQAIYRQNQVARSVKRCAKVGQPSHDGFTSRKSVRNAECSRCIKTSDLPKRRNINVLSEQCIICKEEKYTKNIPRRDSGKSSQFANTHQVSWK